MATTTAVSRFHEHFSIRSTRSTITINSEISSPSSSPSPSPSSDDIFKAPSLNAAEYEEDHHHQQQQQQNNTKSPTTTGLGFLPFAAVMKKAASRGPLDWKKKSNNKDVQITDSPSSFPKNLHHLETPSLGASSLGISCLPDTIFEVGDSDSDDFEGSSVATWDYPIPVDEVGMGHDHDEEGWRGGEVGGNDGNWERVIVIEEAVGGEREDEEEGGGWDDERRNREYQGTRLSDVVEVTELSEILGVPAPMPMLGAGAGGSGSGSEMVVRDWSSSSGESESEGEEEEGVEGGGEDEVKRSDMDERKTMSEVLIFIS
ncbi:uncharacterized protein SEPMUDRAFT_118465 [Sphaerulina musiva SO2202]|uniref:Uncharacterized protein n=1 Tax=Sphaerulina musiva (strain SO2202) TaxID=692275 RepID=M3D113_SPHMS|nr:uncharacterized protein SEPMUDRAFT_118465 [Sphaerulina musiva SO2202]EMF11163.1 hypothetical protein SEPMUDRAFT_118465 [Sphaerulina musiva SO2202]